MEFNGDYWKNPNNCGAILKDVYIYCRKRLTNSVLEYQYLGIVKRTSGSFSTLGAQVAQWVR